MAWSPGWECGPALLAIRFADDSECRFRLDAIADHQLDLGLRLWVNGAAGAQADGGT